jgi:hypothetical protein
LRNDSGTFVLAKMLQFDLVYPVAVGESVGLSHALQWMNDMQSDNIDFELDSKIMNDAFHSSKTDITKFRHIIAACQSLFSTSFTNSRIEFIRQQTNVVAHALATEAASLTSPTIYYISQVVLTVLLSMKSYKQHSFKKDICIIH